MTATTCEIACRRCSSAGQGQIPHLLPLLSAAAVPRGSCAAAGERAADLEDLLGRFPISTAASSSSTSSSRSTPSIDIPDEAFEQLFAFFDQYDWHLDNRPLRTTTKSTPMSSATSSRSTSTRNRWGPTTPRRTSPSTSAKNTVIPFLFDAAEKKCADAFEPDAALWRLLSEIPTATSTSPSKVWIYRCRQRSTARCRQMSASAAAGISPADAAYAPADRDWREHVARRHAVWSYVTKLAAGEVHRDQRSDHLQPRHPPVRRGRHRATARGRSWCGPFIRRSPASRCSTQPAALARSSSPPSTS